MPTFLLLLAGGLGAGLSGSMAGLASLFSYPALLAAGLPAVAANVTNTVALTFTSVGAVAGSRPELAGQWPTIRRLGLLTAVGGAMGAGLLLVTPPGAFEKVVPVLVAAAAVVLLFQPQIRAAVLRAADGGPTDGLDARRGDTPDGGPDGSDARLTGGPDGGAHGPDGGAHGPDGGARGPRTGPLMVTGMLAVAVYGGYFGAAAGVLMLALLLVALPVPLLQGNAIKNALLGVANAVAAVGFALFAPVVWWAVLPLAAGALVGARLGPVAARHLPPTLLRVGVAVAGLGLATVLAVEAW